MSILNLLIGCVNLAVLIWIMLDPAKQDSWTIILNLLSVCINFGIYLHYDVINKNYITRERSYE